MNAPVGLGFQSVAGSQKANERFDVSLPLLKEAHEAVPGRGPARRCQLDVFRDRAGRSTVGRSKFRR
ncbi:ethanolamine ammonia-lyase subunit EutB [Bradyrhizobium sp. ISRA463]|uniref:ethanolamine ammonia-lyase subunit EutB n=1 Tax=unclassified Bradyrhizobium TaxID=2631580 RepID=UPI0032B0513E